MELEADRSRVTDLEAKLARTRREHLAELASMRKTAEPDAAVRSTRALEEARSETARVREQAAVAESQLAAARRTIDRVVGLLDEMERRDEMVSAFRARGFVQARRILAGGDDDAAPDEEAKSTPSATEATIPPPPRKSHKPPGAEPSANVLTLDDLDLDVADECAAIDVE